MGALAEHVDYVRNGDKHDDDGASKGGLCLLAITDILRFKRDIAVLRDVPWGTWLWVF